MNDKLFETMTEQQIKERIKERPFYQEWENKDCGFMDSLSEDGEFDFNGLFIEEQILIYVYAWNMSDYGASSQKICKRFNLSKYMLRKIIKKELSGLIEALPCFSESTGLLRGRAYFVNKQKLNGLQ